MRAAVVERYGPPEVVRVVDRPDPTPSADQVLVQVRASAVTSGDARIRGARFPAGFGPLARLALGLTGPRRPVLGVTFAGEVVGVGDRVTGVAIGDAVCGMTGARMGGHAALLAVKAARAVRVPDGVTLEDAAGVLFGGTTALHYLRRAEVGAGTSVLVVGASGAVGTNAVQLASHLGASVTGVCGPANVDLVRSLGAHRVIDRSQVDVTGLDERFDVVLDTVGVLAIASGRRLLAPGGRLALIVASLGETIRARGRVLAGPAPERVEDIEQLLGLVASGELRVVIDDVMSLDEIAQAHARVDTGHKVGNLVIVP